MPSNADGTASRMLPMSNDIVERLPQTGLTPLTESDLQVVHGLAAELRCIAHDHARDDGFVRFSGTRWLSYYHSLDRILMEHDRRQAEIYKSADEIERLRAERDEAMEFVRGVANDVNALSTLPKDAIKFSELVYTIQVWGDNANEILTKKENA